MMTLTAEPTLKVPRFRLGIRQKILLALLIVLLTALSVSGWIALREEKASLLNDVEQRGANIGRFAAKSMALVIISHDHRGIQLLLNELTTSTEVDYAKVIDTKGHTLGESGLVDWGSVQITNNTLPMFTHEIHINNKIVGTLYMGINTAHIMSRQEAQKYNLLTRGALIILLVILGQFLALSYIIVHPVGEITKYLRQKVNEEGQLVGSIPTVSNDEFGQLAQQFSQLGNQLNEANTKLHTKIESADRQLLETNQQLKQLNDEFRILSITDPLTGLFNRRHFDALMETEVQMSNRHGDANSILLLDIDFFKAINDTYGHYIGDVVLKKFTKTLRENIRQTDAICRLGGEEFAVLSKRAGKTGAMELAEKLRATIETTPMAPESDSELMITVSIGVASVPDGHGQTTPKQLYKDVDTALYYSKNNGRNRITHISDLHRDDTAK